MRTTSCGRRCHDLNRRWFVSLPSFLCVNDDSLPASHPLPRPAFPPQEQSKAELQLCQEVIALLREELSLKGTAEGDDLLKVGQGAPWTCDGPL